MKKPISGLEELIMELENAARKEMLEGLSVGISAKPSYKHATLPSEEEFMKALDDLEEALNKAMKKPAKAPAKKEKSLKDFTTDELRAELENRDGKRVSRLDAICEFKENLNKELLKLADAGVEFHIGDSAYIAGRCFVKDDATVIQYKPLCCKD